MAIDRGDDVWDDVSVTVYHMVVHLQAQEIQHHMDHQLGMSILYNPLHLWLALFEKNDMRNKD
jgi:hypothetical protein